MLIYAVVGGVGLCLLFVMLIASSFGDGDVPIHEASLDHGDLDAGGGPSPLGTRVIAAFVTFFGVGGIVGQHFELGHPASSGIGVALGLVAATAVHRFAKLLYSQQASTGISMRDLVNREARVTVAIPDNGVGEVALMVGLEETVQLARSVDGGAVPAGGDVVIQAIRGSQVIVSARSAEPVLARGVIAQNVASAGAQSAAGESQQGGAVAQNVAGAGGGGGGGESFVSVVNGVGEGGSR